MADIHEKIDQICERLGGKVTIAGHHYQSDDIIRHVRISGDSLELSQKVAQVDSQHIVFCGVHFMAESAALLTRANQNVYLPAPNANCVMAQMVPPRLLDAVMQKLADDGERILPLAYVNTPLAVKAVVGKYGGAVCTSANAERMLRWAFERSEKVLFLPDKNLGMNTANILGLEPEEQHLLDVRSGGARAKVGGRRVKLLLWPGQCAIHARFKAEHIARLRARHHSIKIAVHPECPPELVNASDAAGSTSSLIKFAQDAPDGSIIGIGTEAHLVQRLAKKHHGRITVIPLVTSSCSGMAQTTPEALLRCLLDIESGSSRTTVIADKSLQAPARASLTRMLDACRS